MVCPVCQGLGAEDAADIVQCPRCSGYGRIREVQNVGGFIMQQDVPYVRAPGSTRPDC